MRDRQGEKRETGRQSEKGNVLFNDALNTLFTMEKHRKQEIDRQTEVIPKESSKTCSKQNPCQDMNPLPTGLRSGGLTTRLP